MRPVAPVLVALLVATAGCAYVFDSPSESSSATETAPSDEILTEATATDAADATGDAPEERTSTPAPSHPWAGEVVVVGIDDSMPDNRSFEPIVRAALATWNGTAVAGGTVKFRVVPNTTAPDLLVSITPTIRACGDETATESFYYCTTRLEAGSTPDRPVELLLAGRYANATFREVAIGGVAPLLDRDSASVEGYPPTEVRYADPWPAADPVVVNITNRVNESRAMAPLVRQALNWWASQPAGAKNYSTRFVVRPDARRADLQVRLVRDIERCGIEEVTDIVGCADLLNQRTIATNATVRIEAGYTNASTLRTLKHEFGHIYGRQHGQAPMPVMNATQETTLWPRPNATDRPFPWQDRTLTVYVAADGGVDADDAFADIESALEYYEDGADGWTSEPPTFERVDSAEEADIVVRVTGESACGFDNGGVSSVLV